ncbi:hypothetical protein SAMN06272722_108328 [Paenibacillus sp. RU5A]|nr:hypothetical protein SAMN06272722_108328 [Paenibacillus sp. RU5A]SOC73301.1 hypothetical protein SAMN05880581_108329 [Paenibacillus sp. RU26A]SOC75584.1 hypothetical protein SAMN05880586_108328 [Paenibacillus sp. RU5M]
MAWRDKRLQGAWWMGIRNIKHSFYLEKSVDFHVWDV